MTSGLIRELGDEHWTTLCILAMHMKENGRCYPSQDKVAKLLGIGRQAVNKRIRSLLNFRFNGEPIIELVNEEGIDRRNNVYRLLPTSQLSIFNGEVMLYNVSPQDDIRENISPEHDTNYITVNKDITDKTDNNCINVNIAEELKNAPGIIKYFCKKYYETYSVEYNVNWQRVSSMVKNKLIKTYSLGQIKDIIDVTFKEYDRAWASDKYPRPTIGQLVTWIPNKALAVLQSREKKLVELKKAMNVKKTGEDVLDLMDRGLQ